MTFQIIWAIVCVAGAALLARELLSLIPKYKIGPLKIRGKNVGRWVLLVWFFGMSGISEVHFVQPQILRILIFIGLPVLLVWLVVGLSARWRSALRAEIPTESDS